MAQAPIETHSQHNTANTPTSGRGLSYTKEKAKQELFKAIEDQNVRFGQRENTVKDRFQKKIDKFKKQGKDDKKAQELATKQIQRVRAKVFKDKLATPGTKAGEGFYKNVGDSDGEGAIFLLKKFIFGKKQSFTTYLSHEDIEKHAQSEDLKDAKVLKFFLDGGGLPGMTVHTGESKGIHSPWHKTKIVMDHHPEGPTSTTGMVGKLLELVQLVPEAEKKTVEKFMRTIDIADSFLSKAGRTIDVEKEYAKTLIAFSYQLESDELYKLCSKLPENIWPLTPLPDNLLNSIEVTMKWKKDLVKLSECVAKKQTNINAWKELTDEKIKQKQYVTIEWKKFIIFWPKDNISNDVRALMSASKDFGTIKVHDTGDMFIVHDEWIPKKLNEISHTIRDVIMVINANTTGNNVKWSVKKLCDMLPDSEGKKYILSLVAKLLGQEKAVEEKAIEKTAPIAEEEIKKEEKKAESFVEKVAESPVVPQPIQPIKKTPSNIPPFIKSKEISAGFKQFGTELSGLRWSFKKWITRKK